MFKVLVEDNIQTGQFKFLMRVKVISDVTVLILSQSVKENLAF